MYKFKAGHYVCKAGVDCTWLCTALQEMRNYISPLSYFQANPPQVVQDKILSMIQDWADAFRGSPDLSYVLETYETLRAQGLKILPINTTLKVGLLKDQFLIVIC